MVQCCAERAWAVGFGFTPPKFAVSWVKLGGTDIVVNPVDTTGTPSAPPLFIKGTSIEPRYVLSYADHVLVGDCSAVVRLGVDGTTDPPVSLPVDQASSCDVGVAASRLRMARVVDGVIRWSAFDLGSGAGPTLLTFGTNVLAAHLAWDHANGFGVVFADGAAIRYAHVQMCAP
jgi:hypothetical protein